METAKGVRDVSGEEAILKQETIDKLRKVSESYGFSPLETPIIERFETLSSKYAGGSEILKETFKFKDQGNRELGLRYDLTVPLARFIAMNPQVKLPFKRYQTGEVFRDGPIKLGRYREFTQFDVDVVGSPLTIADAEIISLTQEAFKALSLDVIIKVNSRKIMNAVISAAGINEKSDEVILTIDKLEKLGLDAVKKELKEKKLSNEQISKLVKAITIKGSFEQKIKKLSKIIRPEDGLEEIKQLFSYLSDKKNVEFDVSLARGLTYYTGTVFEVVLKKSDINSAVAGGGRYDDMIGLLCGTQKNYPATGISFGLDVIIDALKSEAGKKTVVQAYIIPIKAEKEALKVAQQLRKESINTDIDLVSRGISKNMSYADSLSIPYVVFIGKEELKQNKVKLRDMKTGKEKMVSVKTLIAELKK